MSHVEPNKPLALPAGWRVIGALSAVLVLLWLAGDSALEALRYERSAVLAGQVWRLVSCHAVHAGLQHLLLNLAGMWLLTFLFSRTYSLTAWVLICLASMATIAIGFIWLMPQLEWYVGASGVLHGVLAAGAVAWWRLETRGLALALTLVLVGKLAWEQFEGALPLAGDLPVIVQAHLFGAIGGVIAGLWVQWNTPRS